MNDSAAPAAGAAPQLDGKAYLRLIGIGAVVGIPAALVAVAFLAVVHYVEGWLWTDLPKAMGFSSPPWWMIVGLPVVGALLVWAARALLPGDGGHEPLHGISFEPTLVSYAPSVMPPSNSRTPATIGPPNSADTAENTPAVETTCAAGPVTFHQRTATMPTTDPSAISGASGPSTSPNASVATAARATLGA